ncbi:MAG: hydantoinase/oxoprolinase family protein [Phascolarctobacterium faecium]
MLAGHGAKVAGYPTAVRSFHMRSVGIGGDSRIRRTETGLRFERIGPAMAVGGCEPTLSDALIVAGRIGFGDKAAAHKGMQQLCLMGETAAEVARQVVEAAVSVIEATINEMLHEWSIQPVYTVNDVIKGTAFEPELLVGVGGGAAGLIMALGERMGLPVEIPAGATVANAVGRHWPGRLSCQSAGR